MENDQLTAVGYLRTAAGGMAELQAQQARCQELADSVGARLVAVYADRRVSGTTAVRPGLSCLLDHLRRDRVDIVVAGDRARLARDAELASELERTIEDNGATLMTEEPGVDAVAR